MFVTAVHTFAAEHGDELQFESGDRIEVLEKDDAFGDGWWRGRNTKGEEGLFPATYIEDPSAVNDDVLAPPIEPVHPTALPEESPFGGAAPTFDSVQPVLAPKSPHNVMGTTIDSVQNAIESISKPESDEEQGELGIGQTTRARLAAQAQRTNESRAKRRTSGGVTGLVYSDESDDEEDDVRHSFDALAVNGKEPIFSSPQQNGASPTSTSVTTMPPAPPMNNATSLPLVDSTSLQPALPLPTTPPSSTPSSQLPYSWTVDEVVAWAKSRGFDEAICDRFREHEITGDLLLELDANLLKELDIPQFGKRLRIAQAISELRRPVSLHSSQPSPGLRGVTAPPLAQASSMTPPLSNSSATEEHNYNAWSHGRKSSGTPTVPSMEPIREGNLSAAASSMPPSPVTPSTTTTKRESTGSIGHKRGKPSLDQKDRLSFFGRNRKPAPAMSPGPTSTRRGPIVHQISAASPEQPRNSSGAPPGTARALDQIGTPDYSGYMKKKGDRYSTWKTRFFVLKGSHLYYMKSEAEDRVKGHIDVRGHRVIVDENTNPGSYGFRLIGSERPHAFSSSEQTAIREWMKALMKATIARDYSVPVTSSCNIPTIPLAEAQALAPRPPSPATRDAIHRDTRRENTNQLTAHDASVLMSLDTSSGKARRQSQNLSIPTRPSRDNRRASNPRPSVASIYPADEESHAEVVSWVNNNLPPPYPKTSSIPSSFMSGEAIFLLVRSLSNIEPSPPVPPNAFAPEGGQPGLSGLFSMMDMLIDAGIDTAGVSINDIRLGDAGAITRLLKSIRHWQNGRAGLAR